MEKDGVEERQKELMGYKKSSPSCAHCKYLEYKTSGISCLSNSFAKMKLEHVNGLCRFFKKIMPSE
jgi:hypothetical protein